ncbi:MAG TPA: phosphopantothenoylcysteine decarboxylase [Spirochaetota bacterium]|nr:phosphopantothenoylcysteine decarboxylase [Spirochaetota bacterium]
MLLKESKIIVTGGPTREWFDPIRYISNASSGKMGIALADEAFKISKNTLFIHGPISEHLVKDKPYECKKIETTSDLLASVLDEIEENSVLIMCAAPADYTPVEKSAEKIKKQDGDIVLHMKRTPDILKNIAEMKKCRNLKNFFVAGFAAETTNTENYAMSKLAAKDLDMICLNDVSQEGAGFEVDTNIMTLFTRTGLKIELPILTKEKAASEILKQIGSELLKRGD